MTTDHKNLAEALAAFQSELPRIVKDETARIPGKNGAQGYTYGYADLAQVTEVVSPVLGRHGLAFTAKPTMHDGTFGLVYKLTHASGETDEGFWPVQLGPMQSMGSAITYARRYALMSVTNTFPDKEDDDGASATQYRGRGSSNAGESWDDAQPARAERNPQSRPSSRSQARDEVIEKAHKAIAAAKTAEGLPALREAVDARNGEGILTDDDAMSLYAAINGREAELKGNHIDTPSADSAPAQPTHPAPATQSPPAATVAAPMREVDKKRMFALFHQIGKDEREEQLRIIQAVLRREVASRNDVTQPECRTIIAAVEAQINQGAGRTNGRKTAGVAS